MTMTLARSPAAMTGRGPCGRNGAQTEQAAMLCKRDFMEAMVRKLLRGDCDALADDRVNWIRLLRENAVQNETLWEEAQRNERSAGFIPRGQFLPSPDLTPV